ncbi:MAG: hypothetical protein AAFR87_34055, partial [Bacteroidota bacterium]
AFQKQDLNTIHDEIEWLSKETYVASLNMNNSGDAMCAAGNSRYAPSENSVKIAQVIKTQMESLKALLEEDQQLFETKMKEATALEDLTDFPTGPPRITKPSFELYGEWLLEQGRYEEASQQFDKALMRMPKRSKSLEGKLAALKALKQIKEVAHLQNELRAIYAQADAEVKEFLTK